MVLGHWQIETLARFARLAVGPEPSPSGEAIELQATWALLEHTEDVEAVLVIIRSPLSALRQFPATDEPTCRIPLGPKANGLSKPVGVAVQGAIRDEALQLVAEADVVVVTPESSFADTSAARGELAVNAFAMRSVLPRPEVLRMAIGGEAMSLSSDRAAQLGLVDAIVPARNLEAELTQRLARLLPG